MQKKVFRIETNSIIAPLKDFTLNIITILGLILQLRMVTIAFQKAVTVVLLLTLLLH